jgi:hypothetical protein
VKIQLYTISEICIIGPYMMSLCESCVHRGAKFSYPHQRGVDLSRNVTTYIRYRLGVPVS